MEYLTTQPLTQGNLNQGHFYLGKKLSFFPKEAIGGHNKESAGRPLEFCFEGINETIHTDIEGEQKGILRNGRKKKISKRFMDFHDLKIGDEIFIIKETENRYLISTKKPLEAENLHEREVFRIGVADTEDKRSQLSGGEATEGFIAKSETRGASVHDLDSPHAVYCFGLRDNSANIIGVKFGYTNDITRRLSEINKYRDFDPSKFEVIFHRVLPDASSAEELEQIVLKNARETKNQTSVEMFRISESEAKSVWSAGLYEWEKTTRVE